MRYAGNLAAEVCRLRERKLGVKFPASVVSAVDLAACQARDAHDAVRRIGAVLDPIERAARCWKWASGSLTDPREIAWRDREAKVWRCRIGAVRVKGFGLVVVVEAGSAHQAPWEH